MKKVFIATSRKIGEKCIEWAQANQISGYSLCDNIENADIIISVLYDKIFKKDILEHKKCYNFHPGILPDYRGTGICSWVIINEEQYHGVTLHVIDEGVDTGAIIQINKIPVLLSDTAFSLFTKTENIIFEMFQQWYHKLLASEYTSTKQLTTNKKPLYKRKHLKYAMNLTKFARAFYFPDKEPPYFYDRSGEKKYIDYGDK